MRRARHQRTPQRPSDMDRDVSARRPLTLELTVITKWHALDRLDDQLANRRARIQRNAEWAEVYQLQSDRAGEAGVNRGRSEMH